MQSTATPLPTKRPQKSGEHSTRQAKTSEPPSPAESQPASPVGKRSRGSRPKDTRQRSPTAAKIQRERMANAPRAAYAPPAPSPGSSVHQHDGSLPAGTTDSGGPLVSGHRREQPLDGSCRGPSPTALEDASLAPLAASRAHHRKRSSPAGTADSGLPSPSRHRRKEPSDGVSREPSLTAAPHASLAPPAASRAHHRKRSSPAGTADSGLPSPSRHRRKEPSDGVSREPSLTAAPHVSPGPHHGTRSRRNDRSSAGTADSGSQSQPPSRDRRQQPSNEGSQGPSPTAAEHRERKRKLRAQEDETKEPFWEYVCIAVCIVFVIAIVAGFAISSALNSKKHVPLSRLIFNETLHPLSPSAPSLFFTR
ncbi:serine/arginine repetitive matrix protein 1-like isoform X1 [Dermacentor albipictus]|uniref:serine/arginine repetitive matrix protein 1-like isoform X1 n=1 Tax=Dermacentor albipictus TaxID=60249 RepID=UPI0031FBAFC6